MTREDYLKFLMNNSVATPDEVLEYVALKRPEVDREWARFLAKMQELQVERMRQLELDLALQKSVLLQLRSQGLFDHAVKREEHLANIERELCGLPPASPAPDGWRGSPVDGWGDERLAAPGRARASAITKKTRRTPVPPA